MPKIFALRHQLAEQQKKLKEQAKGSSGDSPTNSDEEKLEQGPSSSSGENTCVSDNNRSNVVTSQNYIVQSEHGGIEECEKSVPENTGDNRSKHEQNAPLELIHRQRSTGKINTNF